MPDPSSADLARESREIWERNAAFWDEYIGEGNDFHRLLIAPAAERLLDLHGERNRAGGGLRQRQLFTANGGPGRSRGGLRFQRRVHRTSARAIRRPTASRIAYHIVDATAKGQLAVEPWASKAMTPRSAIWPSWIWPRSIRSFERWAGSCAPAGDSSLR